MGTTRTRVKALGMLSPDRLYTAAGLRKHAGIGHEVLRKMRVSGSVKYYDVGVQRWYRGSEVIAWIESQAK
jgi:hypothetical protein